MKLDKERLLQYRYVRKDAVTFNVKADYDHKQKVWVDKDGSQITNVNWSNSDYVEYPLLNDKLVVVFV